jgi:LCP family protein required for cell wall assembly
MGSSQPRIARRRPGLDRLSLGLLIGFIILAIITALVGFFVVRDLINSWNMTNLPGAPQVSAAGPVKTPDGTGTPEPTFEVPLQNVGDPTPVPWDGASRVNVLLMGLDYSDVQANEKFSRTDSMILLTVDPVTKTAGMLSISRNLWVNIPGFDYGMINTAYRLGNSQNVPGGGAALVMATVEQFLGVPIQYYAVIDYEAFVKFIDAMGGLTIKVPDAVHDLSIVGKPGIFVIHPGVQNLDGATTLAYARARHEEGDDPARSKRQQEVILAIRQQILDFNMLPTLIAQAPTLYKDISGGIRTNLTLDQVIKLAILGSQVKTVKSKVINYDSVLISTSPDGMSILIPIPDKIRLLRDSIFTIKGPVGPAAAAGNPAVLMADEKSRISVQNGTQYSGLATQTSEYLKSMKLNVVEEKNADQAYDSSVIIIYTGKPYTVKYLADMMKIPSSHIFNRFNPDSQVDVAVILGNDWANKNPMPSDSQP